MKRPVNFKDPSKPMTGGPNGLGGRNALDVIDEDARAAMAQDSMARQGRHQNYTLNGNPKISSKDYEKNRIGLSINLDPTD